jgi:hypothetical protein
MPDAQSGQVSEPNVIVETQSEPQGDQALTICQRWEYLSKTSESP